MMFEFVFGAIVTVGLFAYLILALLRPDHF